MTKNKANQAKTIETVVKLYGNQEDNINAIF